MSNTELKVINAVCENKDISTLLAENVDDLFVAYQDVWRGIKSYYAKFRAVPDISILQERFKVLEKIEVKGQTAYYVETLKNEYINAELERLMLNAVEEKKTKAASQVLETLQSHLGKLGRFTNNVRDLDLTDADDAKRHYEAVRERASQMGGSVGIPTGLEAIDAVYPTGMAGGHLIIAIGWPGKAKTWFTSYLACQAWNQGFKPMVISLEMSPETMRDRIYTMMGSGLFRNSDLSKGDIKLDDFDQWSNRYFDNKQGFVVVSNEGIGDVTPNVIQAKIDKHRPDIVICDYHQLFTDNDRSAGTTERNMNLSKQFKRLATSNNIPIIDITAATASEVSDRENPPMMSQVAWSKQIEYDADLAFAVHRHDDSGLVEVVSRKNRHGGDFAFMLEWDIDRGIIKPRYDL